MGRAGVFPAFPGGGDRCIFKTFWGKGIRGRGSVSIRSYRDLEVWKRAMDLVVMCYESSQHFPPSEVYGLTGQLRRAAVSVPSNIAEGRERKYTKEFIQYLSIAYGSLAELETHIQIAYRLGYISAECQDSLLDKTAEIGIIGAFSATVPLINCFI